MRSIDLAIICTFLPLATSVLLVAVPRLRRSGKAAGTLSIVAAAISVGAASMLMRELFATGGLLAHKTFVWLPHAALHQKGLSAATIEVGIHLDGISVPMLLVVCVVALCVQLFSWGYLSDEPSADFGRYFTWQSLFLFSMNSLVVAPNLLQLFLGWELVGLVSYLLIGYWWKKPSAARAAVKAFWITKFADMGLLAGLILLFVHTGSFDWTTTTEIAPLVTALFFVAVMGKSAQFPLHVWLPDAMEGPTPVSALLHAATMVAAGVFLVVRSHPLYVQAPDTQLFMAYVGAFTAVFAATIAVVQNDIKKVLAYSTCSQLGYMVCALGAGSQVAGFFHLTTHSFFKAMLFLAAGALIHAVHSNDIRDMGGLFSKLKFSSAAFVIGALSLSGFPGLSGFFSKDLILEDVAHRQLWLPLGALLLAAFLTAFYMGRVMFMALWGRPSERAADAHEAGLSMQLPLLVLVIPTVGLGFAGFELSRLYAEGRHFELSLIGVVATALGLSGLGLSYWMFGAPQRGAALRQYFVPVERLIEASAADRFWAWTYRSVVRGVADAAAWIDRYIIDGLINVTAYGILESGSKLRVIQTGRIQDYVYVIVAMMVAMGFYGAFGR